VEPDHNEVTRRGVILFALLGVGWGIPYLLIKVAVRQLDPTMLVFTRMGLAALILLPVAAARGDLAPVLRRWRPLLSRTLQQHRQRRGLTARHAAGHRAPAARTAHRPDCGAPASPRDSIECGCF